MLLKKG